MILKLTMMELLIKIHLNKLILVKINQKLLLLLHKDKLIDNYFQVLIQIDKQFKELNLFYHN